MYMCALTYAAAMALDEDQVKKITDGIKIQTSLLEMGTSCQAEESAEKLKDAGERN